MAKKRQIVVGEDWLLYDRDTGRFVDQVGLNLCYVDAETNGWMDGWMDGWMAISITKYQPSKPIDTTDVDCEASLGERQIQ